VASIGPEHRRIDRFLLVVIPAAFFVYQSTRPLMRLQADVPPQFQDVSPGARSSHRASDERVARAYWNCAVTLVQWRYTYGTPLPQDPPDDFRIDAKTYGADLAGEGTRLRYWSKLREAWLLPECWRQSREWTIAWIMDPASKAANSLSDFLRGLVKT
jgi:hypothetical protein